MTQTPVSPANLFAQVFEPAHRHNPYLLYEQLRETPIARLDEYEYIISTYDEIWSLLHHPSISKEQQKSRIPVQSGGLHAVANRWILFLDPPEHDRLRRLIMNQFTPERITGAQGRISETVTDLLNAQRGQQQFDLVQQFAYPLPVTIICALLGVPREDEQRFHVWVDRLTGGLDPTLAKDPGISQAFEEIAQYMRQLIAQRRADPKDDMLTGLALGNGPEERMDDETLVSSMVLLLLAGHETTVNILSNSMLTLLRYPQELQKLREHPERVPLVIEETLRYEPPVQFASRFALADIAIRGTTIPQGSRIWLMLAAGSRDPQHFAHPNEFDPDRPDNEHLGFGGGVHYCVGAPLARLEASLALPELARRLVHPRLVIDPPPYRANAVLRGPQHLLIAFEDLYD